MASTILSHCPKDWRAVASLCAPVSHLSGNHSLTKLLSSLPLMSPLPFHQHGLIDRRQPFLIFPILPKKSALPPAHDPVNEKTSDKPQKEECKRCHGASPLF